jgi:flagellar transcriptional activator FlhC
MNIYKYLREHAGVSGIEAIIKAYRLYLEQLPVHENEEPVLSLTRAWTLVRFFDGRMLTFVKCVKCQGQFVAHNLDLHDHYACGLCHVPSRAGKTKRSKENETSLPMVA